MAKKKPAQPVGYTCECGRFHEAGGWGAAHWHEELEHYCGKCGRTNIIKHGEVIGGNNMEVPR